MGFVDGAMDRGGFGEPGSEPDLDLNEAIRVVLTVVMQIRFADR